MPQPTNRPLEVLPGVQLSPDQIGRLRAIEQYDLWFVVERLVDKQTVAPHLIDLAVLEFRKYMALVAMGYDNLGMHSQEIDEVWHAFILFTREYSEFCNRTCGRMVHHIPNTSRRPELPAPSVPTFKEAYKKYFGTLPPIWRTHSDTKFQKSATGNSDNLRSKSPVKDECDTEGEEPEDDILAGDCDVVQAPCSGAVGEDCDSSGQTDCRASLPMDMSEPAVVYH